MIMDLNIQSLTKKEIISSIIPNEPDDVFICCSSPEERCKGAILRFNNYKAKKVFLIRYNGCNEKKKQNIIEMKNLLKNFGDIVEIKIHEQNPIPILMDLIKKIEVTCSFSSQRKITIDVSTMIKWHILILLKYLELKNLLKNVRILYTEPQDYETNLFNPLSFGIKKIFPIPLFSGEHDFSNESMLIIMLGYEGNRALALLEKKDPNKCLLLIAKPPYHKEWEGRTEEMNKAIINLVGESNIRYIDSRNPMIVANQLRELLSDPNISAYNHYISPLGTKPQTIGLYLYLSTKPQNTILIYGSPLRHNELFYSHGIGDTWILPIH